MKKLLGISLMFVLLASAVLGCGAGTNQPKTGSTDGAPPTSPAGATGENLRIATYAYFVDPLLQLDPANTIYNGVHVLNNIYETLLKYDPETGDYEYVLATGYEKSHDGLTWTFHLRKGVKFHNGDTMTAEDVKFSIERVLAHGQGASYIWEYLDYIEAVDDNTVVFHMKQACPVDLIVSCCKGAHIVNKRILEEKGDDWFTQGNGNACGTGPYQLHSVSWGTETVLSKFDDYWGGWKDNQFDIVVTKYVSENSARRQMVESGDAYVTNTFTAEDLEAMSTNPNVRLIRENSIKNLTLNISVDRPPLDKVNVRKALAYAMPYQKVIDFAVGFNGAVQSHGFVPEGLLGYSAGLFQYTYDLDKAKALLDQEGITDLNLLLIYQTGDEAQRKTAELFQTELAKIGVNLELRAMTWDQMVEMAKGDTENRMDLFMQYAWPDRASAYDLLRYAMIEDVMTLNYGKYHNEEVTQLIKDAFVMSGIDTAKAESMYIQAQEALIEDCALLPIVDLKMTWAVNKHFGGFAPNGAYAYICDFYDTYYVD